MVNLLLYRTLLALYLHFFFYAYCEIIAIHSLQDALYLDTVSIEHLYLLANEVDILLWNLEWLTQTSRTYFQLIVLIITTQSFLDISTQSHTIFNPYTIYMVNLDYDTIVWTDFNVHQEIFLILEPFIN